MQIHSVLTKTSTEQAQSVHKQIVLIRPKHGILTSNVRMKC